MASIAKKITINAPVEKVFAFLTDPENWTKYVTSLIDVKDVSSQKAEAGTTFKWTYRMFGMNFHGKGEVTENVRNKTFGLKMQGSFPIIESYTFASLPEGTELSFDIQYEIPGKIMGVLANKGLMEKLNKKETENVLSKVKLLCEEL